MGRGEGKNEELDARSFLSDKDLELLTPQLGLIAPDCSRNL